MRNINKKNKYLIFFLLFFPDIDISLFLNLNVSNSFFFFVKDLQKPCFKFQLDGEYDFKLPLQSLINLEIKQHR